MTTLPLKRLFESASGGSWGVEPEEGEIVARCIRGTDFDFAALRVQADSAPERGYTRREFRMRTLRPGDLVVEKSGGGEQQPVGRVVLFDHDFAAVPTNFAGRLRAAVNVDARFACYLLASLYADGRTRAAIKQTTGIQNLDLEALLSHRVWQPTPGQQRAIADFLDGETARIDALIAKKRRLIELLDEMRMPLVTDGVRGVLIGADQVPARLPWLESRASGWREAKLTLVADLGTGHTPSREHPEWWVDCSIPWITTGEVAQMRSDRIEFIAATRESISELGIENSSAVMHPAETVVLCRTASAGYSAIMGRDMATSQDFVTWNCGPLLRPRFLLLCLRAMRQDLLGRLAMGSTHKTIYMPDIESLRVVLPPVEEQDQIVNEVWRRLRPVHQAMDATTRQIDLLVEHRQALITAAVTGELAVPGVAA